MPTTTTTTTVAQRENMERYIKRHQPTEEEMQLLIAGTEKVLRYHELLDLLDEPDQCVECHADLHAEIEDLADSMGFDENGHRWISLRASVMLQGLSLGMMQRLLDYLRVRTPAQGEFIRHQ